MLSLAVRKMRTNHYEAKKNPPEMRCNASYEHCTIEGKQLFQQKLYKTATSTLGDIGRQKIITNVKGIIYIFKI